MCKNYQFINLSIYKLKIFFDALSGLILFVAILYVMSIQIPGRKILSEFLPVKLDRIKVVRFSSYTSTFTPLIHSIKTNQENHLFRIVQLSMIVLKLWCVGAFGADFWNYIIARKISQGAPYASKVYFIVLSLIPRHPLKSAITPNVKPQKLHLVKTQLLICSEHNFQSLVVEVTMFLSLNSLALFSKWIAK